MQLSIPPRCARSLALTISLAFIASTAAAQHYNQVNLVSNQTGQANNTDLNLVNGWGIARSSTSPWWVSDNGTGKSTVFNATGATLLTVTVPGAPTGMV